MTAGADNARISLHDNVAGGLEGQWIVVGQGCRANRDVACRVATDGDAGKAVSEIAGEIGSGQGQPSCRTGDVDRGAVGLGRDGQGAAGAGDGARGRQGVADQRNRAAASIDAGAAAEGQGAAGNVIEGDGTAGGCDGAGLKLDVGGVAGAFGAVDGDRAAGGRDGAGARRAGDDVGVANRIVVAGVADPDPDRRGRAGALSGAGAGEGDGAGEVGFHRPANADAAGEVTWCGECLAAGSGKGNVTTGGGSPGVDGAFDADAAPSVGRPLRAGRIGAGGDAALPAEHGDVAAGGLDRLADKDADAAVGRIERNVQWLRRVDVSGDVYVVVGIESQGWSRRKRAVDRDLRPDVDVAGGAGLVRRGIDGIAGR